MHIDPAATLALLSGLSADNARLTAENAQRREALAEGTPNPG
jgi:hypothetical protein